VIFSPAASSCNDRIRRSCCRHFPSDKCVSTWNSLSIVLLLAPARLQTASSERCSLGSRCSASATRTALASTGLGSCSGIARTVPNDDDSDETGLNLRPQVQARIGARMQNQFLQNWRNINHAAGSGKASYQPGSEVDRPHRYCARHDNAVRNPRRNPDGPLRRNNPRGLAGSHRHHSSARVHQLVFGMKMLRNGVPVHEVVRERGHRRREGRACLRTLSYLRHLLS